jgi:hypothetical protein
MDVPYLDAAPQSFELEGVERYYSWYALFKYQPFTMLFSLEKEQKEWKSLDLINRFRKGEDAAFFASLFAESIAKNTQLGPDFLSDKVVWKLPRNKNARDYKSPCSSDALFCEELRKYCPELQVDICLNGGFMMELISPKNGFELGIAGKHFVLFDDVRFSGLHAQKIALLLIAKGVKSVHCFYLSALKA